jgi:predicted transcriptional regulator
VVTDFNTALSILENGVRRSILERLVREPHYPLQLSELLDVSQQAIMKHLKILQESGFVTSEKVPSEKGGPPKRIYAVTQSFSLRLDLGPDLFRAEHRKLPEGGPVRLSGRLPEDALSIVDKVGTRRSLPMAEAMALLTELNDGLDRLDAERDALIALHQQIKHKASRTVDDEFQQYEERQLAHALLEAPRRPLDLDLFCAGLQIQPQRAEEMMDTLRSLMMRQIGLKSGTLIAATDDKLLPWWLAK